LNIFYTETSKNAEFEQMNYRYAVDKFGQTMENPVDCDNHIIDPVSYGIQHYFNHGVIKNI
jgi:phage terminase large subunit